MRKRYAVVLVCAVIAVAIVGLLATTTSVRSQSATNHFNLSCGELENRANSYMSQAEQNAGAGFQQSADAAAWAAIANDYISIMHLKGCKT